MKALLLVADGFEDLTAFVPLYRLREEGIDVTVAAPSDAKQIGVRGYALRPTMPIHEVNPADYAVLVLPDGPAVERLRLRPEAVDVARTFVESRQFVAAIGHGPQLLLSAGTLDGKAVTCSPGIRDDVRMAGAIYRDEATVLDGDLLTARGAEDLPEFCRRLVGLLTAASSRVR